MFYPLLIQQENFDPLFNLKEIFQSHPFQMTLNFETQSRQWYEANKLNLCLRIREILDQGLEHLFSIFSNSHFFNKTDLEPLTIGDEIV